MIDRQAWHGWIEQIRVNTTDMTEKAAKRALVTRAIKERDRVLSGRPKPSGYRQVVDFVEGRALTDVKPDGVIVFAWQYLNLVVAETLRLLVQMSPRRTGEFIQDLLVNIDGIDQKKGAYGYYRDHELPDLQPTSVIRIVATADYSRRLEIGLNEDGRPFVSPPVEYRFIEKTASIARSLMGDLAQFEFEYVDRADAWVLRHPLSMVRRKFVRGNWRYGKAPRRLPSGHLETTVRYPAIKITAKQA